MSYTATTFARLILSIGFKSDCQQFVHGSLTRLFRSLLWIVLVSAITSSTGVLADSLIDINNANASVLSKNLPGIGPAKAKSIIDYRLQHGAFKSIGSLINVKGIGPATLEKIRALLFIAQAANLPKGVLSNPNQNEHTVVPEPEAKSTKTGKADVAEQLTTRAVRAIVDKARRQQSP